MFNMTSFKVVNIDILSYVVYNIHFYMFNITSFKINILTLPCLLVDLCGL